MNDIDNIIGFHGEYQFLSNFYPCKITFYEMTFPSVEAAFQAAKCVVPLERRRFLDLTPAEAKRLGRRVRLREDWEKRKLTIMHNLLVHKFEENPDLRRQLLRTGAAPLVEANTWHDNFWGDCTCPKCKEIPGQNRLGRLLMQIRADYIRGEAYA